MHMPRRVIVFLIGACLVMSLAATASEARGWLGIHVRDVTPEAAGALGVPRATGALVVGVEPSGPAARAGVQAGDVVVEADGFQIVGARHMLALLNAILPDHRLKITVVRQKRPLRLQVLTETLKSSDWVTLANAEMDRKYKAIVPSYIVGDRAQAMSRLVPLALAGHRDAQNLLGFAHEMGGVPSADMRQAAWWYRLAAEQGSQNAQHNLAALYEKGAGVPRDHLRAFYWFSFAAEQGGEKSAARRDRLLANMSPAIANDGQRLIIEGQRSRDIGKLPGLSAPPPRAVMPVKEKLPPEPKRLAASRAEVAEAQRLLADLGFDPGPADGVAGRGTLAAVRAFQQSRKLQADRRITPDLLLQLRESVAALPKALAVPEAPATGRTEVMEAQRLLADLGYDPGPADGVAGRGTQTATRAFQRSRKLMTDGRITPDLLLQLRAAVAALPVVEPEITPVVPEPPVAVEALPELDHLPEPTVGDLDLPAPPTGGLGAEPEPENDAPPAEASPPSGAETETDDLGDLGFPTDLRIERP